MTDLSQTSRRKTSKGSRGYTFSAALGAGLTHSGWLVGPTTDPSGQEAAHASHSVLPERVEELTTSVTFGQLFGGSSPSEDLQSFLANRLRRQMGVNGSAEYELTWKSWDMQSGPPICALRAAAVRTSGNGFSGWHTPRTTDAKGGRRQMEMTETGNMVRVSGDQTFGLNLSDEAHLTGWPSPCSNEPVDNIKIEKYRKTGKRYSPTGYKQPRGLMLEETAIATLGPTPSSSPAPMESGDGCRVSGWQTPNVVDQTGRKYQYVGKERKKFLCLPGEAELTVLNHKQDGVQINGSAKNPQPSLKLNPRFSLWLMGYPIEWAYCGERVTASSRK